MAWPIEKVDAYLTFRLIKNNRIKCFFIDKKDVKSHIEELSKGR